MFLNRRAGEESDGDSPRDMSSDGSSECRDLSQNLYRASLEEKPFIGSSSDESEVSSNSPGDLVFEYLEAAMPFGREPLTDKASYIISTTTRPFYLLFLVLCYSFFVSKMLYSVL